MFYIVMVYSGHKKKCFTVFAFMKHSMYTMWITIFL